MGPVPRIALSIALAITSTMSKPRMIRGAKNACVGHGNFLLTHSLIDSLIDSLTHALTHPLTHSSTHSLTYSLTLFFVSAIVIADVKSVVIIAFLNSRREVTTATAHTR